MSSRTLAWLLAVWLITSIDNAAIKAEQDFVHLFEAANSNRRIHISAEIVQQGQGAIYTDEFLDLDTLNQLIQIKWSDTLTGEDGAGEKTRMRKLNLLILNSEKESFMYRYEPFRCEINEIPLANSSKTSEDSWHQFISPIDSSEDRDKIHQRLVDSLTSQAPDSPYWTRIEASSVAGSQIKGARWILGVSGLWAKAQFGGSPVERAPSGSGAWRIRVANLMLDYYTNTFLLSGVDTKYSQPELEDDESTLQSYDAPSFVVIKDAADQERTIQMINLFQVEYNFGDRLAKNLFKLPIGFKCPPNPYMNKSRIYLRDQGSQLVQLEIVASKLAAFEPEAPFTQDTQIKSVQILSVKHPVDLNSNLVMFHSREDRFKLVWDHFYQLEYRVDFKDRAHRCAVRRLNFELDPRTQIKHALSPNPIHFDNGISLDLSQFHLSYLLNIDQQEDNVVDEMRMLNLFEVSDEKNELIFESEVPEEHMELLTLRDADAPDSRYVERQLTIVRVYEQQMTRNRGAGGRRAARAFVDLKRVLILAFDVQRKRKLAEVRLNLVEDIVQLVSHSRRAKLIDLSACFDRLKQTMELVVTYPADPKLLEFAQERGQELVEHFYQSSIDWHLAGNVADLDLEALNKERLGLSLNFMRMPRVTLQGSSAGDLELRVLLLDKATPLQLFERVANSTFVSATSGLARDDENDDSTSMLLESVEECARFCQLYDCKVFAYNTRSQCRLTHLPLLSSAASKMANETRAVRLTLDSYNEVYFEPEWLRGRRYKEATLAELGAYVEHFLSEIWSYSRSADEEEEEEEEEDGQEAITKSRNKRSAGALGAARPMFSFDFVDTSNLRDEFAPPSLRMLVPNELSIIHLPLVFDVSQSSQVARVSKSFRVTTKGSMYHVEPAAGSQVNEANYIDQHDRCFYTLREIRDISQDNCALLCFNIDEWDARTNSQQQCVSFSYSHKAELCVLAVQTDFAFVSSASESLLDSSETLAKVSSLSQLLVATGDFDGLVVKRNYLQQYEGPIRMPGGAHGEPTTAGFEFGLEFEWLRASLTEASVPQEEERESCAAMCASRNKLAKKTCLAFDFCATKFKAPQNVAPRYQALCELLLVDNEPRESQNIAYLRNHLSERLGNVAQKREVSGSGARNRTTILSDSCNRYLLSHLHEFTHFGQRQLVAESTLNKLEAIDETVREVNLDRCALECSMRGQQCALFEFCMSVDGSSEQWLSRNCTLYRSARSPRASAGSREDGSNLGGVSALTSYNRNCHVYLRKQFNTIEEAIADGAGSGASKREFQHARLTACFSIVYFGTVVGLIVYVVRKNNLAVRERLGDLVRGLNERYLARR